MSSDLLASPRLVLQTVQWTRLNQIEDLSPISEDDYDVLDELREVLLRRGYQDRFGVCLLHKHFDLQPGEAALEESNEETRVSTITVVPESVAKECMETAWQFARDGKEITAARRCNIYCRGFGQTGHSRQHACEGHY